MSRTFLQSDHEYASAEDDEASDAAATEKDKEEEQEFKPRFLQKGEVPKDKSDGKGDESIDSGTGGKLEHREEEAAEENDEDKVEEKAEVEDGDEEEEKKEKASADDADDRRNPQYIPRKGMFYEHDDRLATDEEEEADEKEEKGEERESERKRGAKADRWGHDKFLELDQLPKSHDELVQAYGYDIREEDNAPRARRRRK